MSTPERAGWYDDPDDESQLRYFDGIIWSDRRVPRRTPSPAPIPEATPAPGTGHPQAGGHSQAAWGQSTSPQSGWEQPHAAAPPTTQDGQPLAGYGVRLAAFVIDALILGLLNLVVAGWAYWLWFADYWAFAWDAAQKGDTNAVNQLTPEELLGLFDWSYFFIASGLTLLIYALYQVASLTLRNATPGKAVLGLSVRAVDRPGRLGLGTAFMRTLLPLFLGVFFMVPLVQYVTVFVWLADVLWPLRDGQRQALHDKIGGTLVVVGKQIRESGAGDSAASPF